MFLDCLVREIEQRLSSSATFSMNFSWRLPKGLYPCGVKNYQLSSSMEYKEIRLPMRILDDLAMCPVRVKIKAQSVLQAGPTPAEVRGKETCTRFMGRLERQAKRSIEEVGGRVLRSYREKDVAMTTILREGPVTWNILLRGKIDLALLTQLRGFLFTILFEVTEYEEAHKSTLHRLQCYASALYGELGFPVVPVLVIVKDEDTIRDVLILRSKRLVPGVELKRVIKRLIKVISGEKEPKPAGEELCRFCDLEARRICPYTH